MAAENAEKPLKWFKVFVRYKKVAEVCSWETLQAYDWRDAIERMSEKCQILVQSFTHAEAQETLPPEDGSDLDG